MTLPDKKTITVTAYSLLVGALGAYLAYLLSFPVYLLTGPAIVVSLMGLCGVRFDIADIVRDASFLLIGISIGSGVTSEATAAFLRWPVAFLALGLMLFAAMAACRHVLNKWFNFDRRSAVLAASPGHLSYVLSMGTDLSVDVTRIAIVQSIRVLALTLLVPFVALAFGISFDRPIVSSDLVMRPQIIAIMLVLSLAVGLVLKRFGVPAALLIGGMTVSTLSHVTETVQGSLPPFVVMACFVIIGTLIGSRFSGVTMTQLRNYSSAGLISTLITLGLAVAAAIPVAVFLEIPIAHVVVAFAPGGLETMVAMGAVVGANPGFVAACHVGRLVLLTFLVPMMVGRNGPIDRS